MREEIKKEWTAALRSGKYTQGKNCLRDNKGNYCCLGVLCEIAVAQNIIPAPTEDPSTKQYRYGHNEEQLVLPQEVYRWAEIKNIDPSTVYIPAQGAYLSQLNDSHELTFPAIADIIERNL